MFTIQAFRRIGVADIATGSIAIETAAVIPAACILIQVTAEGTHVANLWAGDNAGGLRQHAVAGLNNWIIGNFSQRSNNESKN